MDWTDLFCGGGGSSLGLAQAGFDVRYALNHWDKAVLAHNANFPQTDHEVSDVQDVHPRRFGRTRGLWASPSCTHYTFCRGRRSGDEEAERSRATMWDVVRFSEHHRYEAVVVENVIEVRLWDEYEAWYGAMERLGYVGEEVYFNSQFAGVPQSRDRLYVVWWRRGAPPPELDFRPASWCLKCEAVVSGVQTWKPATPGSRRSRPGMFRWGRYGTQYVYTCPDCSKTVAPAVVGAHVCIDHGFPIRPIGARARPLAAATRQRIRTGWERLRKLEPVQVQVGGHLYERPGYARVWALDEPMRTVTTTRSLAIVLPNMTNNTGRSVDEPMGSVTTGGRQMLIQFRQHGDARPVEVPAHTVSAGGLHHGLLLAPYHGQFGRARSLEEPSGTVIASDKQALLVYNGTPGFVRSLEDAAGTVTARDKQGLLVPYNRTGQLRSEGEPLFTVDTRHRSAYRKVTDADIDAALFRMLQWQELQRAQSMDVLPDGSPYRLTIRHSAEDPELTATERIRMIGNAVSSPVAALLGQALAEVL